MKKILYKLFLMVFVLVTSCNSNNKENKQEQDANVPEEVENISEPIAFTDTKWKLVALMGQEINDEKSFISFATEDNRVFGNSSCNNFTGTYELKEGNQIVLSKIATTMMACPDMTIEEQFKAVLEKIDSYSLNGNKMTLNKAKMAPLAVFELAE